MYEDREKAESMVAAWIEERGGIKRYTHGERPEGAEEPSISVWGHKRRNKAEVQAAKDGGGEADNEQIS